jgi:hypothetical protein
MLSYQIMIRGEDGYQVPVGGIKYPLVFDDERYIDMSDDISRNRFNPARKNMWVLCVHLNWTLRDEWIVTTGYRRLSVLLCDQPLVSYDIEYRSVISRWLPMIDSIGDWTAIGYRRCLCNSLSYMCLTASLSTSIFQLYHAGQFYWWMKQKCPVETTHLL